MRALTSELGTYTAASAAALAVDIGLLTVLVSGAGWRYLPAAILSFIVGGVFLYSVCVVFVFQFRRIDNPALELPCFIGLGLAGLVVNTGVMFVIVEGAHAHYLIAKASAAACTFTTNFLLRRRVLFTPSRPSG